MKKIRYLPFGYTIRNGHTVIEQQEADIVRNIFRSYIRSMTAHPMKKSQRSLSQLPPARSLAAKSNGSLTAKVG